MPLSHRFYYNSKQLRRLKRRISGHPAYLVMSYPNINDEKLAVYLGLPVMGLPISSSIDIERRSLRITNQSEGFAIKPRSYPSLINLSDSIREYCSTRKCKRFIVKIDLKNRSTGTALLSYPFGSLP
jgi:hypothetical protein